MLRAGGVQRHAGAVHQHPHGGGGCPGEPDRERAGHPDLVHGLRAGCGRHVHHASITADKVKIPRKWDDSFSAFNGVVQQSGMDLTRYKGKTVEKWTALIPGGQQRRDQPLRSAAGLQKEGRGGVSAGKAFRHGAGAAGRSERTGKADFRRGLQRRLGRVRITSGDRGSASRPPANRAENQAAPQPPTPSCRWTQKGIPWNRDGIVKNDLF